ncbi:hypothetical protein [Sulfurimonas sp.]|uniref:hypothetical protein n=1 Tax=Sulfurimonas sp. TaxID=2022749 RepID=UPI0026399988|nr:hypothetical protein [Sulfurimonas sp.]MCW8894618.1 hypothetical protein [Sulfurimonas sp.]MCW9067432.1 hypothetical protein [Sulfurimonas sp.]
MRILKLSTFILVAALLMGFGVTTASAETESVKSEKFTLNIDGKVCNFDGNCKCEKCDCSKDKSSCTCTKCECGMKKSAKAVMKCGAGKCGAANTPPNTVMKCGAGKCGSN